MEALLEDVLEAALERRRGLALFGLCWLRLTVVPDDDLRSSVLLEGGVQPTLSGRWAAHQVAATLCAWTRGRTLTRSAKLAGACGARGVIGVRSLRATCSCNNLATVGDKLACAWYDRGSISPPKARSWSRASSLSECVWVCEANSWENKS